MFLHADILHIGSNMLFLWIFGDNVEDTFGHVKFLMFYLVGGLFAEFTHIASALISGYINLGSFITPELTIPTIGASGAISAVLGAYILLFPQARIRTVVYIVYIITFTKIPAFYYLGFWFLYQVLMGLGSFFGLSSSVAFWAHIGGFALGMAVVKTMSVKPKKRQQIVPEEQLPASVSSPMVISPLVDVLVDEDRVTVLANLPGLDPKDIKIEVSEREVVISSDYMDMKFFRQVSLPVPVKPRVENLLYRNGVLSFTMYRTQRT
jgi:membrane associated rhomboid family serine protease